jgi:glutaminyl-tRNA synthetase
VRACEEVQGTFALTVEGRGFDSVISAGGKDFIESLNPSSLKVVTAMVEPSLASAQPDQKFQFERHGYFTADRVDHVPGQRAVFNLAVGLRDGWGK